MFNARQKDVWKCLNDFAESKKMQYLGYFPCVYSAQSLAQDNRQGSLKTDYAMVFSNTPFDNEKIEELSRIPGWCSYFPMEHNDD